MSPRPELDRIIRMSDGDPRTEILRLERQIEDLTEVIERCRKIILISKIAVASGGIWLLALTIGIIRFDPVAMIGAIAVVIGGTVVFGSNTSTLKQSAVAIQNAEALRAELIGKINLRVVQEQTQS
jgi:hypothetical protein